MGRRPLVDASPEDALAAVIGYSAFNDVTARTAQKRTSQWTLGTGKPAGVGYARTPPRLLRPGDTVEGEVERLGVVCNSVVGNERTTQ